jgi:hypothetical protein
MCCDGRRKLEWERAFHSALAVSTAAMQLGSAITEVTANISSRNAAITLKTDLGMGNPAKLKEASTIR